MRITKNIPHHNLSHDHCFLKASTDKIQERILFQTERLVQRLKRETYEFWIFVCRTDFSADADHSKPVLDKKPAQRL